MTIYKLTIMAYDYWYSMDRDGFQKIEKFFTTKEKAEKWIKENPKYIYCGFNDTKEATENYQMPTFEITEIKVE